MKKKFVHIISGIAITLFIFVSYGINGWADATQDMYIQDEKDPVQKEKMRRVEDWYQSHGRTYPSAQQYDSIYDAVDRYYGAGIYADTTTVVQPKKHHKPKQTMKQDSFIPPSFQDTAHVVVVPDTSGTH